MLGAAQCLAHSRKCGGIHVIAIHISQLVHQHGETIRINSTMLLQAVFRPRFKLFEIPACLGDANYGSSQLSTLRQPLQGGENLFVGEISGSAEEDYGVGIRLVQREWV